MRLHQLNFQLPSLSLDTSLQDWIEEAIDYNTSIDAVQEAILSSISTFMVDGSFYPDCLHLIVVVWRSTSIEILLAIGKFISSIKL